jgi:hypothetical protein
MRRSKYLFIRHGLVLACLLAATAWGQNVDTGRITGEVHDISGAVVHAAQVSLKNTGTGQTSQTVTDTNGLFVSPPLAPGEYEVEVQVPGFNTERQHLTLEVAQRAALTIALSPGSTSNTVDVEASGAILEAESTTLSNVRTEMAVENLPLDGRNFANLMGLTDGATPAQTQITGQMALSEVRGATGYSVNGLRMEENHILLDGISDSENHNGLGIVIFPPLDAIEEFREETSVPDARYGRGGGGTVNLVFKSGTAKFHGEAFEYLRNSDFDARNFFDKSTIAPFKNNQFGGTFGGPLERGADPKTFFFADYQGTRTRQGLTFIDTVPTAAYREGDFAGAPQTIYNPATTTASGAGYTRSAFVGNVIPPSMINPVSSNLINLYPLPNLPGAANNFLYSPVRSVNENEYDARVDHRFSDADNGFLRYSQATDLIYQPGPLPAPAVGGVISGTSQEPSNQAVLTENHVFSPAFVNTARVGWSRIAITTSDANAGNPLASKLGIPGSNVPGDPLTDGLPLVTIAGATTLGSAGNLPAIIVTNNYQLDDNVSISKGKHTIQIGGQFQRLQYNLFQVGNLRGTMGFTTAFSSNPAHLAGTGIGLADLLLGAPVSGSLQYLDGTRGFRQSQLAFFVQDDYKLTEKLTLNLGLRYENYLGWPWQEVDRRAYAFDPANGGTVAQVGTDGIPVSGVRNNKLNFMPRIGLAYRLSSKTVFRAAYGIFYSAPQLPLTVNPSGNPPDIVSTAFTNNQYSYGTASLISNGFNHPAVGSPLGSGLTYIPLNTRLPQTQQWNAAIQHQFTPSTIVTIAYAGTSGNYLEASNNLNQPVPGNSSIISRRPFPLYSTINEIEDSTSSKYNGLQISAERRFSAGLAFQVSYSYSHALDYISQNPGSGGATFLNTYNHKYEYGNSDFNIPNRFIASWNYLLPFKHDGFLHWAVNGWQLNGILSLYDGLPFTVYSATNTLNIGGTSHAQYAGTANGTLPSGKQSVAEWFNVAAFTTPGLLQWGNVGRNTLSGPPTRQLDASLFKNFKFGEGLTNLQFRTEVFNLLNTPQFNNPAATIGAAGVGTITSSGSPYTLQRLSREIQFALKLSF